MLTLTTRCRGVAKIRGAATLGSIVNHVRYSTGVRLRACWHALLLHARKELIDAREVVFVVVVAFREMSYCYQVLSTMLNTVLPIANLGMYFAPISSLVC